MLKYLALVFALMSLSACAGNGESAGAETESLPPGIQLTEDGVKYLVHPSKILSGGPPKDGIPSIDNPRFVSVEEANEWLGDNELVMAIRHKGITRVYPFQILVWHEIVNDSIAGDPILVTYCPLCGSGIAFEGRVQGQAVEFGTTGKLYNSNLIMYDRRTDTYWTQIEGKAIIGELTGTKLKPVSADTVDWGTWKQYHPDSQVLSRDTGYSRSYGRDPYGNYYTTPGLFFPVENSDERLHPKTVIFGIEVDGVYKAYRQDDVIAHSPIVDTVNGVEVRLERDASGIVTVTRSGGGNIAKERDFWFAWFAFHPDTEVYQSP